MVMILIPTITASNSEVEYMYELIKEFEGFREKAYVCPAGQWTIGYGSTTYADGTPVKKGDKVTREEADKLVKHYCENKIKMPKGDWTDGQREALCSLIYNIGQGAFDRSKLKKALENHQWDVAYKNWDWVRAGGKVLPGLVKRRDRERKQFFLDVNM